MGPRASSTGTLKAARNWAATSAGATWLQRDSASTSRTATGLRCRQATMQGPAPSSACTPSARSAWASEALAPGQLALADQHQPGPISLEQQLGRVHDLLEGLG
jgi:hypothetical protein